MKIQLRRNRGVHFTALTEAGHRIELDGAAAAGGANRGARPMEAVLAGLGGCSAVDVLAILNKSRQQVTDCRIDIEADRADAVPPVFTRIHLHYTVSGHNLDAKKAARAVALAVDKYCSVARMLAHTAVITHGCAIVDA